MTCPVGYYCDGTVQNSSVCSHGVQNPESCPTGYYCPLATKYATQYACPDGSFNAVTNLEQESDCTPCSAGQYCATDGLSAPTGNCSPGYYCDENAKVSNPTDGTTGDICPAGSYCVSGSSYYTECPKGTYNPSTAIGSLANCTDCDPGMFCSMAGLTTPSGNCSAGYYCILKSEKTKPDDGVTGAICPKGSYCPEGTGPNSLLCPPGSFSSLVGKTECFTCNRGKYCIDGINEVACPQGFYCPSGTGTVWGVCPLGSYGSQTGFYEESQCSACDGGEYCALTNLTSPNGPCDAGFYCRSGSDSAQPSGLTAGDAGPCPVGHYCESGTQEPTACPIGTFSNETLLEAASDCTLCTPSYYCDATGLTMPVGLCNEGFYCSEGANSSSPPVATANGGPCPTGTFCLTGTSVPVNCPAGTYNDVEQMSECKACPEGYYCVEGSTTNTECPTGNKNKVCHTYPTIIDFDSFP